MFLRKKRRATGGPCRTCSSGETMMVESSGGTTIGGGWDLLFLRWDFFPWQDRDNETLWDWDLLFLRWGRNSDGLQW
jgi:hypothetical protein